MSAPDLGIDCPNTPTTLSKMPQFDPYRKLAGGFSPRDGTVDFYLRIRTYLKADSIVLDFGAGRGGWFDLPAKDVRRWVRYLTPDVKELVAADVADAVNDNPSATRAVLIHDGRIPLPDNYFDVIIADYVLEHITDPQAFVREVDRLLKPGGIFCARTPHAYHYAAVASRLIGNAHQSSVLSGAQPERAAKDVFPTVYRLNTLRAIHRAFRGWESQSFIFSGDPGYFFGSKTLYRLFQALHSVMPTAFHGNIFAFLRKPD
jgi:SAM-dependent methyltransferase